MNGYIATPIEEIIRNIQEMLLYLSRYIEEIERVNPDGIYGSETESSVKSFQRYVDIDDDGRVDYITFTRLCEVYDDTKAKEAEPKKAAHYHRKLEDETVDIGEIHDLVMSIQIMLNALSLLYELERLNESGEYDEDTKNAVKQFQRVNGFDETGEVDKQTWDRIAVSYEKLVDAE